MLDYSNMKHQKGQTLIEVLIAITLIVMVLITLVSALTLGIRNNKFARDATQAKDRSREAIEWIRNARAQMEWDAFYDMINDDGSPVTYCLQSLPGNTAATIALSDQACGATSYIPTTLFIRSATFTIVSVTEITAVVTVTWTDGGKTHQSTSTLILRNWL